MDTEGKKFGKSEGGAIWLSAEKLSPYKFYQYLFSTTDADVIRFLKMLTFVPLEEIESIEGSMAAAHGSGYVANSAQRRLAEEVTRFVHGEEGLAQALSVTEVRAADRLRETRVWFRRCDLVQRHSWTPGHWRKWQKRHRQRRWRARRSWMLS